MRLVLTIVIVVLLNVNFSFGDDSSDLTLRIDFLDAPPYQHSWLPWKDDHFRIVITICNSSDTTWTIDYLTPCYDCNPKFHLEESTTGKEAERVKELDVFYIVDKMKPYYLNPDSCYIDTLDIALWIEYNLKKNQQYRFWIEYEPLVHEHQEDIIIDSPVWQKILVSDTLEFTY